MEPPDILMPALTWLGNYHKAVEIVLDRGSWSICALYANSLFVGILQLIGPHYGVYMMYIPLYGFM